MQATFTGSLPAHQTAIDATEVPDPVHRATTARQHQCRAANQMYFWQDAVRGSRVQPLSETQTAKLCNPLLQDSLESNWKNLSMGVKLKRHHHKKPQTCRKSLCWLLPSHWDRAMGLERFTLRAPSSSGSLTQGPALPSLQISTAGFSKQD